MDMLIVTAYYPVKTGKHSTHDYTIWIANFFESVTCPVYFFCSSEIHNTLKNMSKSNVTFIQREFDSFDMMKEPWKSRWKNFYNIDHEKNIHSPELYAIWSAKQEFVREAIKLQDSNCYIWCDVGCFRTKRDSSFKTVMNYIQPEKITCLHISNTIGGGVLAGDKDAWKLFSNNYLQELEKNINGKDQIIYQKILNKNNAVIIEPTNKYGDPWFYLTSLFSEDINLDYIHHVVYINLEHRKDRKQDIEKQLSIFPYKKVQRFNAILDKRVDGHVGCGLSHIAVLEMAISNNWKNVLIVEDDMKWNDVFQFDLLETLAKNPYDAIVLGGTFIDYNKTTYKLIGCQTTTCYLVNNHYFEKLLNCFKVAIDNLIKTERPPLYAIDVAWKSLQKKDNWYLIYPALCIQRSGFSDICNVHVNYEKFFTVQNFLTVHLMGGLGNQLFQLAFLLYASKISENPLFLDNTSTPNTHHSNQNYFESIFKKWKTQYQSMELKTTLTENSKLSYENWPLKINSTSGNTKLVGYFHRYQYIDLIKDEFISKLSFDQSILEKYPTIQNKFFIHVRGGDYKGNSFHYIDLSNYYRTCIDLHKNEEFVIFTNDIPYAKGILPHIPIIEENEMDTLLLMSKCKGCICANSSFSWWGAYLNSNRPIYFPSKWFNDDSMDTSGYFFRNAKNILSGEVNLKTTFNSIQNSILERKNIIAARVDHPIKEIFHRIPKSVTGLRITNRGFKLNG